MSELREIRIPGFSELPQLVRDEFISTAPYSHRYAINLLVWPCVVCTSLTAVLILRVLHSVSSVLGFGVTATPARILVAVVVFVATCSVNVALFGRAIAAVGLVDPERIPPQSWIDIPFFPVPFGVLGRTLAILGWVSAGVASLLALAMVIPVLSRF